MTPLEIRDPIHGNIDINDTEFKIIDTQEFQRLRYLKQLGLTYLVFPGANHSRYEHSLGVMQATKDLEKTTRMNKPELSYVGLLHDIGHGPFSHLSEVFIKKYLKKDHEKIGEDRIKNSEIRDIISASSLSFDKILRYFRESENIDIVGGAVGSDRLDYLMRDAYYTGVAYGLIDYDRLKSRLVLHDNKIALLESGIPAVESMLIARYFMHSNVYRHHTTIIAVMMLQGIIGTAIEAKEFTPKELIEMHDEQLMGRLENCKSEEVSTIANRIRNRRLFKRAYYEKISSDVDGKEIEDALTGAGFSSSEFGVEVIKISGSSDDLIVVDSEDNVVGKLAEVSPFIKTLNGVLSSTTRLLVACDKKNKEKVESIVKKFV